MRRLRAAEGVLVVEGVDQLARDTRRAPIAIAALAGFVAMAVTGMMEIPVAAMIAALHSLRPTQLVTDEQTALRLLEDAAAAEATEG